MIGSVHNLMNRYKKNCKIIKILNLLNHKIDKVNSELLMSIESNVKSVEIILHYILTSDLVS
jgi:hypothetical protein